MVGVAFLAIICLSFGWLGYQLVITLLQPRLAPLGPDSLAPFPPPQAVSPLQPAAGPAASRGGSKTLSQAPGGTPAGSLLSLRCLTGGQGELAAPAHPSNYGPRLAVDWQGRSVNHVPTLIVLHETVVDERTALGLFRSLRSNDAQQASYHVLIGRDGSRIRVVSDADRAYGAGDSDFAGLAVQLKPGLAPSVNNVALHVSLVSPPDGADGERRSHSGYTPEQYRSLAIQIGLWQATYNIPPSLVVTHREVDRSGSRRDPRSFDWTHLGQDLSSRLLACGGSAQMADLGRSTPPR